MKPSYTSVPSLGATAEESGPSSFHQQVFLKWTARGRVAGRPRAGACRSSLERLFGQLWRQTWGHTEVGRGPREEQAKAGKRCPQPVLLPLPPAELHRAPRGKAGRMQVAGAGAWTQSPCQPWTLYPGLPRAPNPSVPQKREGPHHWRVSPTEGIHVGRQREARPDIRGPPAQDPSRKARLALQPAPL